MTLTLSISVKQNNVAPPNDYFQLSCDGHWDYRPDSFKATVYYQGAVATNVVVHAGDAVSEVVRMDPGSIWDIYVNNGANPSVNYADIYAIDSITGDVSNNCRINYVIPSSGTGSDGLTDEQRRLLGGGVSSVAQGAITSVIINNQTVQNNGTIQLYSPGFATITVNAKNIGQTAGNIDAAVFSSNGQPVCNTSGCWTSADFYTNPNATVSMPLNGTFPSSGSYTIKVGNGTTWNDSFTINVNIIQPTTPTTPTNPQPQQPPNQQPITNPITNPYQPPGTSTGCDGIMIGTNCVSLPYLIVGAVIVGVIIMSAHRRN